MMGCLNCGDEIEVVETETATVVPQFCGEDCVQEYERGER